MMPAITGLSTPRRPQALDQVEVVVGVEEELGDGEVGRGQLLGGVASVALARRRARVRFGMRGDAHREVADLADEPHELDRVLELTGREIEILGRVAPQREDVVDPGVAVARDDLRPARRGCARRT